MPSPPPQFSPLLNLPEDLRRKIYRLLPRKTKHLTAYHGTGKLANQPVVVLVMHYIERSIIQTCRLISKEAEPVLEIETMNAGPPKIICHGEYFHRVPDLLRAMRDTQNDHVWQRLRLRDADRNSDDNAANRLLWTRLSNLQLQARKRIQIGVFVPRTALLGDLIKAVRLTAVRIYAPQWWESTCSRARPRFEVWIEWEAVAHTYGSSMVIQIKSCLEAERMTVEQVGSLAGQKEVERRDWGASSFGEVVSDMQ